MYGKTKKLILSQANQIVPNKWPEIRNAALQILPAKQSVSYKSHRRVCQLASLAVCLCVVISAIVFSSQMNKINNYFIVENSTTKPRIASTEPEVNGTELSVASTEAKPTENHGQQSATRPNNYTLPPWDDRVITSQFQTIEFNGYEYRAPSSAISYTTSQKTSGLLSKQTVYSTDPITNKKYQIDVEVYSLQNILSNCVIAVKFKGYDELYPFFNPSFSVNSLVDLLTAIDFKNTVTFGEVEYTVIEGKYKITKSCPLNKADVWKYLFSDITVKSADDKNFYEPLFAMTVNAPAIGMFNKAFIVTADGYIDTNIINVGHSFYIGEDKVEAFKKYVLESGKSHEISRSSYRQNTDGNAGITAPAFEGYGNHGN